MFKKELFLWLRLKLRSDYYRWSGFINKWFDRQSGDNRWWYVEDYMDILNKLDTLLVIDDNSNVIVLNVEEWPTGVVDESVSPGEDDVPWL